MDSTKKKTQKVSNEGVDRFSNLPDPIFHHILSFLPPNYDSTELFKSLGLVSKSWLSSCFSYPKLDFSLEDWSSDETKQMMRWNQFVRFTDYTMAKFLESDVGRIQRLKLNIDTKGFPPVIDKWINIALDNQVGDLDIGFHESDDFCDNVPYEIPKRVLCSGLLKSLSLRYQVRLPPACDVNLQSLKSLEIFEAQVKSKDLRRLLKGCPLIESLIVAPASDDMLKKIVVSGLKHIKMINICPEQSCYLRVIVEAPTLETLCLNYVRNDYTMTNIECPNLKFLKFMSYKVGVDEKWLHTFLSKFPLLETLELHRMAPPERIKIKNPVLKKVELVNIWSRLVKIYSDLLNVLIFRSNDYDRLPSIWVKNPPSHVQVHLEIHDYNDKVLPPSSYLNQLRKMLNISCNHRALSIKITSWSLKKNRKENEGVSTYKRSLKQRKRLVKLSSPECEIDELNLDISGYDLRRYSKFIDRLFSLFHPSTLRTEIVDGSDFTKVLCRSLASKVEDGECYCYDQIKCWKHQLKEVKIEGLEEHRLLDWCKLFELLPTLKAGNKIRFRLQWAT